MRRIRSGIGGWMAEAVVGSSFLVRRSIREEKMTTAEPGKPVARLVPRPDSRPRPDVRRVIEELKEFGKGNTLGDGLTIREMIEEGRRF